MGGIAGFWKASGLTENDSQHLDHMLHRIRHRGPDGSGSHINRKQGLAFGQVRLAINDLQKDAKPLSIDGQELILSANTSFYNFKTIRAELIAEGNRFTSKTDSEIALHLYRKYGLDFLSKLRGEFAFSLYDAAEDRLLLVRDRFGIKPLFYHVRDGAVYYASEVKALLAHPDIPVKIDSRAALHQLMQTMLPATSAFEGIRAVKPGHFLSIRRRGEQFDVSEERYWDLDFPKRKDRDSSISPGEHVDAIRQKLVESVVLRLDADAPIGCYLSGGIDSCSILGLASAARQERVKAFTIAFDSTDYDESKIAVEMGESVNADQEMIHLKADDLYGSNYIRTMWHAERTFYNTLGVAKWCMSRHVVKGGHKAVLTGEGADELFGGYPSFKRDMFLHGLKDEPEEVVRTFREAMDRSNKLFSGAILAEEQLAHPAFNEICGFTPSWIQPWMATLEIARPLLAANIRDELADYDPIREIAKTFDTSMIDGRHPLDIAQYTWSKTMLEGQILNWGGDRVDMANAMESRPAFLDHHLVERALLVPPSLRIRGNIEKWVLREAMRGVLPEILYKREKFAFMAPPGHTERKKQIALQKLIDHYLEPSRVAEAGLLDPERITQFLHDYEKDTDSVSLTRKDALLNHLLGLQILHDQFIAGNEPS